MRTVDVNPEIGEAVLREAWLRAQALFGARLESAYLLGSLAHGGFSVHVSDVDLGLMLSDPLGAQGAHPAVCNASDIGEARVR